MYSFVKVKILKRYCFYSALVMKKGFLLLADGRQGNS